MDQKKLLFVINPKAGRSVIKNELFEIIQIFSAEGYSVEVYPTQQAGDAERYIVEHGEMFDVIVCAGGDGTLDNSVAGVLRLEQMTGKRTPLGYIPCGSTNDFARSLLISRDPIEAARQIVSGKACSIDVGKLLEQYFIYVAAFGAFTDVSYSTPQNLKNTLGHAAYLLEALRKIGKLTGYKLEVHFDGRVATGEYVYGQITNSKSVGGFPVIGSGSDMSFSDGEFECVFIRMPENPVQLQRIINTLLLGEVNDDLILYERASKIQVICQDVEVPWTIDGEFGGNYREMEVVNLQKAISVILGDRTTYNIGKSFENEQKRLD